jgi:hypothetical protein
MRRRWRQYAPKFCATANGVLWYRFNGTLWDIDDSAVQLRHELSSTVREQFMCAIEKVEASLSLDEPDDCKRKAVRVDWMSIAHPIPTQPSHYCQALLGNAA